MKFKNKLSEKIFIRMAKDTLIPRIREGKILQRLRPHYVEIGCRFVNLGWELDKQ